MRSGASGYLGAIARALGSCGLFRLLSFPFRLLTPFGLLSPAAPAAAVVRLPLWWVHREVGEHVGAALSDLSETGKRLLHGLDTPCPDRWLIGSTTCACSE